MFNEMHLPREVVRVMEIKVVKVGCEGAVAKV